MIYYKIIDKVNGEYRTLFHGINGFKKVKSNEWVQATMKIVTDGDSKRSTKYLSGWHIMETHEQAEKYLSPSP